MPTLWPEQGLGLEMQGWFWAGKSRRLLGGGEKKEEQEMGTESQVGSSRAQHERERPQGPDKTGQLLGTFRQ